MKTIQEKLEQGIDLTEEEIGDIVYENLDGIKKVYERNDGFDGYQSLMIESVYKIGDNLYTIEWLEGQGKHTPNDFSIQPHKCELVEEINKTKETIIEDLEKRERTKEAPENFSIEEKIVQGYALTEDERSDFACGWLDGAKQVYEEEVESANYFMNMLSVYEIGGKLYAIEWCKTLEKHGWNLFENQPYECEIKEEEREIKETYIKWI